MTPEQLELIRSTIKDITEIETFWEGDTEPFIPPGYPALIKLEITATRALGVDEWRRRALEADEDRLLEDAYGLRYSTLLVKIQRTENAFTFNRASLLTLQLKRRSVKDVLLAGGLAVSSIGAVTDLDYKVDGRVYAASVFEVVLGWAVADLDTSPVGTPTIGRVQWEGDAKVGVDEDDNDIGAIEIDGDTGALE